LLQFIADIAAVCGLLDADTSLFRRCFPPLLFRRNARLYSGLLHDRAEFF
jgi:hypothetical protein